MATEVILMADVEGLGKEGDVVRVADGYARNFLLPKKLAAPVTAATQRRIEKNRKLRAEEDAKRLEGSRELAARIEKLSCNVPVKTGDEGKMFGAVTAAHIADILKAQGIELDRHQIELAEPLRELGVFSIPVRVHPEVQATLKVWIVEE